MTTLNTTPPTAPSASAAVEAPATAPAPGALGRRAFLRQAGAVSAGGVLALFGAGTAVADTGVRSAGAPRGGALDARAALGPQDWMGGIADATVVQRLTIPGTHDSGARFGGPWTECQNITIPDQLNAGVRFLDIRCRLFENAFTIHHEATYQNLNFDDVLTSCRDFLAAHPTETVLMRVKQEYSTESDAEFRRVFDQYLDGPNDWRSLFLVVDGPPALGDARGKVVLIADNAGLPGMHWGDSAVFDIQDEYMKEPGAKYPLIEDQFRKAAQQPGKQYINFVSTAALLPPEYNAGQLNPEVLDFLGGAEASGWTGLGIVPLDFPEATGGLIEALISHNP